MLFRCQTVAAVRRQCAPGICDVLAISPGAFSVGSGGPSPVASGERQLIFASYSSGALHRVPQHGPQAVEALDCEEEPRYAAHAVSPPKFVGGRQTVRGASDGSQRPDDPALLEPGSCQHRGF